METIPVVMEVCEAFGLAVLQRNIIIILHAVKFAGGNDAVKTAVYHHAQRHNFEFLGGIWVHIRG